MKLFYLLLVILLGLPRPLWAMATEASVPALMLAKSYQPGLRLADYMISEKLDGVRAYWDGYRLLTRQGHPVPAPDWFTAALPPVPLEGELWIERGQFDRVSGIVRQREPDESWHAVRFMLFDLPAYPAIFRDRYQQLQTLVSQIDRAHVQLVEHGFLTDEAMLQTQLRRVIRAGGEGLMLRRADALYEAGRSAALLKLKPWEDAEAVVVGHLSGKGKYEGMLGALLVELPDGRRLRLGSGFSDAQRRDPPPLGALISYRHNGLTGNGLPRFARFLRIRADLSQH